MACGNTEEMHECGCACESDGREGTEHISLANFNPNPKNG